MTHKNKRINIRVSKKEGQGEKNMKPIKRQWMYGYDHTNTIQGTSLFIATGETPNGQLFYSMLDLNGNIVPEHEGSFYQTRYNNHLVMIRI